MKQAWRTGALVGPLFLVVACTAPPKVDAPVRCSTEDVGQTRDASTLQRIARACGETPVARDAAIARLNTLAPPSPPTFKLQPPVPQAQSEGVTYAFDVDFGPMEIYPSEMSLLRLNTIIENLRSHHTVLKVEFVGGLDAAGAPPGPADEIARKRGDFVRRYLRSAGLDERVPIVHEVRGESGYGKVFPGVLEVVVSGLRKSRAAGG